PTGLGTPVEPLVWMTAAGASRSCSKTSGGPSAPSPSGASTTTRAPAVRGSRSRRSTGTAVAPSRQTACRATAKSSPAGGAIATRSPARTPRAWRSRAAADAAPSSVAYVSALTAARSGRRRAARLSHASTRIGQTLGSSASMSVTWTPDGEYTDIRYETSGDGIAKLTIARPEVHNAFRPQTVIEMSRALEAARADPEVGVIILTGAGDKAFCSGGDQRVRGDQGYEERPGSGVGRFHVTDLHVQIRRLPKPVVAMVAGYAIGGGHVLHVCCDLTIAADNACFGQTGPRVGSFDGGFGATVLAAQIGQKRAKEV